MNIPGGFPEIKLQPRGGGKTGAAVFFFFLPCACDETEIICGKFTKWFFTPFLYSRPANLVTKHLFFRFQNRQINEVGQALSKEWQDAELVDMSSHRQQPQMLSSHLAPNPKVARSQRPLGSDPTDVNNFLTGVLSSLSHFYTSCPMMQQPAHAHAPSLYRFLGEEPHFPRWSVSKTCFHCWRWASEKKTLIIFFCLFLSSLSFSCFRSINNSY